MQIIMASPWFQRSWVSSQSIMPRALRQRATQNIAMSVVPEEGGNQRHGRIQPAVPVRVKTRRQNTTPDETIGLLWMRSPGRCQTPFSYTGRCLLGHKKAESQEVETEKKNKCCWLRLAGWRRFLLSGSLLCYRVRKRKKRTPVFRSAVLAIKLKIQLILFIKRIGKQQQNTEPIGGLEPTGMIRF
jgi:hypothetical protein